MKSPVYRNLDQPFQVLGFTTAELIVLCAALVGGGEIAQALAIHRVWSFVFTLVLALGLFWMRRSLGDAFRRRFVRFLALPPRIYAKHMRSVV